MTCDRNSENNIDYVKNCKLLNMTGSVCGMFSSFRNIKYKSTVELILNDICFERHQDFSDTFDVEV